MDTWSLKNSALHGELREISSAMAIFNGDAFESDEATGRTEIKPLPPLRPLLVWELMWNEGEGSHPVHIVIFRHGC